MKSTVLIFASILLLASTPPFARASHHHKMASSPTPPHKTPSATSPAPRRDDVLVWIDLNTGAYYLPGDHLWGATLSGEYMSESAAEAAGYHEVQIGE